MNAPLTLDSKPLARITPVRSSLHAYTAGPELSAVRGGVELHRGHSGAGVQDLQRLLNALGARPPLAEDGLFGPKTEAALTGLQQRLGQAPTGRLDGPGLGGLETAARESAAVPRGDAPARQGPARAPQAGEPPPEGTIRGGELARQDELTRARARTSPPPGAPVEARPSGPSAPIGPVQPAAGQSAADAELARLQGRAVSSAQRELAAGVREDHRIGEDRGPRIDQYARNAGMPAGGAWCGYFTGFNYSEAARESGMRFRENVRFHSMQKARSYFEYRTYTNASRAENQRLDTLRAEHEQQGSTRRWMTLSGSGGEQHARTHQRPHEVFEPNTLPIRPGDTAVFSRGHLGMVEAYDRESGRLTTIEGNSGDRVTRRTYDLNDPRDRARFEGFGRPARGDFVSP